jgi:RimJ/RimL family protein N-acetyltransferase
MATAADAAFVAAIENDVELKRLLGGPSGKSEEWYCKFLSGNKDLRFLVIESLTTGFPIGLCGLLTGLLSDDCEVRVIVTKDYWEQGLGTEIAAALKGLSTDIFRDKVLTAKVHPNNAPSLAIIRRLGLAQNGRVSSDSYDNGWIKFSAPLPTSTI